MGEEEASFSLARFLSLPSFSLSLASVSLWRPVLASLEAGGEKGGDGRGINSLLVFQALLFEKNEIHNLEESWEEDVGATR